MLLKSIKVIIYGIIIGISQAQVENKVDCSHAKSLYREFSLSTLTNNQGKIDITYYGIDVQKIKLIGTGEWYIDNIGSEPGLVGAWFVAPNPKLWENFKKKFYKFYNYEPIRLSSLAHDSLTSIFSIVNKNDGFYELNYDDFQSSYGFSGIDGNFKFLSDGTVERRLSILEIKQKGFKIEKIAKKKSF